MKKCFVLGPIALLTLSTSSGFADLYDAPTSYYASATSTSGATLLTQLRTITSSMTGINYGNARYSAEYTDVDPNNPNRMLLMYNRASVSPDWDSGNTWNREHIWPVSRLGVSDPSNSTTGIATDQHNLRPANPSINSSRGNTPYGPDSGSGSYGYQSSLYYPGDADAGDAARAIFYMATRYSSLSIADSSSPSGTQMGDLSSLLRFHYKDAPDTFERRRNHAIYGGASDTGNVISNPYKQGNRNPYVDHPEWVWAVFGGGNNNSKISVATPAADGSSSRNVDFGRVIVGSSVGTLSTSVTISKSGDNPTYYEVSATGSATSTLNGRFNPFGYGTTSATTTVTLNASTATTGLKTGQVIVNNLDITSGGAGMGSADANDTINLSLTVLSHSNASFSSSSDTNTLFLNLGDVNVGSSRTLDFSLFNFGSGFVANLDLDSITETDDANAFSSTLAARSNIPIGSPADFDVTFTPSYMGGFFATYTLNVSDENIPGATAGAPLTLYVSGFGVLVIPEPSAALSLCLPLLLLCRRR